MRASLIAQFVGLPFDVVNDGILRSVSRSVERMLARLLTRRVVVANTPAAVTDPAMLANIVEELVAYNPAAGAVLGVELVRMGHLAITADDGTQPWDRLERSGSHPRISTNGSGGNGTRVPTDNALTDTARGRSKSTTAPPPAVPIVVEAPPVPPTVIPPSNPPAPPPAAQMKRASTQPSSEASGEIVVRGRSPSKPSTPPITPTTPVTPAAPTATTAPIAPIAPITRTKPTTQTQPLPLVPPVPKLPPAIPAVGSSPGTPVPAKRRTGPVVEVPQSTDEITQPGVQIVRTPVPGMMRIGVEAEVRPKDDESRGSILGIGVAHIGSSGVASGEIRKKVAPGARVLVPGPNGLMQSATVRQLLQGYYELEVGGSGETIWVPVNGVVPE